MIDLNMIVFDIHTEDSKIQTKKSSFKGKGSWYNFVNPHTITDSLLPTSL